ncbi:MAG: DNA polymerase II [Oleibacter sp.]|nr:DNA polymerase II [Thalassolituus sp.]
MLNAFLLTSRWHDEDDGTHLTFWWSTPEGSLRTEILHPSVCFIAAVDASHALRVIESLGWPISLKTVAMRLFDGRDVCACYLPSGYVYRWRATMADQGIRVYEVDIRPTDRYLMERLVFGSAELDILPEQAAVNHAAVNHAAINTLTARIPPFQRALLKRIRPANYQPHLRSLSIDIETSFPRVGQPYRLFSIGFFANDFQAVVMLADQAEQVSSTLEYVVSEADLLRRFLEIIEHYDPDVIIGWNVIQFDMAFLRRKFIEHNMPFALGRDGCELEWREAANNPDRIYLHVPGRVVLDGIECLRTATYQFESFALNDVAQQLLQDNKLLHGDDRGEDIERLFTDDKPALAAYNLKDCKLVWRIFEVTQLWDFLIERSQLTGLLMDRMGGSVAAFEYMYLPQLHRAGWVAPDIGDGYSSEKSPGGFVMDSRPGLYEHVLVLDFKSLYPSIIRTFKIDPLGLIAGLTDAQNNPDDKRQRVPGFFGGQFHQTTHLLPNMIAHLAAKREQAKAQGNKALAQAIKIIMASCYGVLGSEGCRFHDTRLSASITKRSHDIIQRTSKWIEQQQSSEAQRYDVIYGDTDSVFVWIKHRVSDVEANEIGNSLVSGINQFLKEELAREFSVDSYLELEYETHYRQFFMPSIRGEEVGSKKRYAGIVAQTEQLVFKGLEAVRTDWTPLAREFQRELYRRVFYKEPYQDWIKAEVLALCSGQRDDKLTYRKRLRRPLTNYIKNRPPHARAAALYDQWLAQQQRPLRYHDRGGWIRYRMTLNGPEPVEISTSAIDYGHYLEKQIQPIADALFQFTGDDFKQLTGQQQRLF